MKWISIAVTLVWTSSAIAGVDRHAIFIGNNHGDHGEQSLRYAVSDAKKMFSTFVDIGQVPTQQAVLAADRSASEVRRAIIETNSRIRQRMQTQGRDSVLFVYYSGHGDEESLHMNGTNFELDELRSLVLSSPARIRVLILDSCRSGPIPRAKGGRPAPRFKLGVDDRLHSSGAVLIAASAANEDAQESDELGGSFFTHHFVSALLGAADKSADGRVSLEEAYAYAYAGTVRSSSKSSGRTQHPSFHFNVKGMDDIILTNVATGRRRGVMRLSDPGQYLVFAAGGDGALVAEVNNAKRNGAITLPAGDYLVRKRSSTHLREGKVRVATGSEVFVHAERLTRIDFARVVRKGGTQARSAHSVRADFRHRGAVMEGLGGMNMVGIRYSLALPSFTISPDFAFGQSNQRNQSVEIQTRELQAALRVTRDIDFSAWTVSLGAVGGAALFSQSFETEGVAPARRSMAGFFGIATGVQRSLWDRLYGSVSADVLTYVVNQRGRMEASRTTPITFAVSAGVGSYF